MSRRTAGLTALAATLVVGGFVPALLGGASAAAGCPSWTDPKGDSNTGQLGNQTGQQGDANLDIVGASLTVSADSITAVIKSDKLNATASDQGDEFHVLFTVGGKDLSIYSDRAGSELGSGPKMPVGDDVGFYNVTDKKKASGKATSVYDVKASTVTITGKIADLATLAGVPVAGKPITKISAESQDYFYGADRGFLYDQAPTTLTATMNADCGDDGGPAPVPTSSPSPAPNPSPTGGTGGGAGGSADGPKAGCNDYTDPTGDATNAESGQGPSDPALDVTGVAIQTTAESVRGYLRINKLGPAASTSLGDGPAYYFGFTSNGKAVVAYGGSPGALTTNFRSAAGSYTTNVTIAGTTNRTVKLDVKLDVPNSRVVFTLDRPTLEAALGKPVTDGPLTALTASGRTYVPTGTIVFDTANNAGPLQADRNQCFGPPPAVLVNTGAVTSQYGDAAKVAAKLTSQAGDALAGKSVSFGLAGKAVIATTNADGVATASIPLTVTAGPQTLSIAFAGDDTADKAALSVPFTVTQEKTKLILAITKKGTARTVVATLLDDDNKPVAGQKLVFAVNGKTVATLTTSSVGKATFTKANPSQTVKVTFAAVTGKWLGTTAQAKV